MNADIVKQMRKEEADLVRKLKAVRDFLAAYGERPLGTDSEAGREKSSTGGSREKVEITSFTEQTRRSVALAMQGLLVSPGLRKTRELVEHVEAMGHEISGQNKVNALGALLARSADIVGHGKSGWGLADREKAIAIVNQYAPKENEPTSENAVGSNTREFGAPTPPRDFGNPHSWPAS